MQSIFCSNIYYSCTQYAICCSTFICMKNAHCSKNVVQTIIYRPIVNVDGPNFLYTTKPNNSKSTDVNYAPISEFGRISFLVRQQEQS